MQTIASTRNNPTNQRTRARSHSDARKETVVTSQKGLQCQVGSVDELVGESNPVDSHKSSSIDPVLDENPTPKLRLSVARGKQVRVATNEIEENDDEHDSPFCAPDLDDTIERFVASVQHVSEGLSTGVHTYGPASPTEGFSPDVSPSSLQSGDTMQAKHDTAHTKLVRSPSSGRIKYSSMSYAISQPRLANDGWAPSWLKNPHIKTGYRLNYTPSMCMSSICGLHNETCNVWSHLLGMLVFMFIAVYRFTTFSEMYMGENQAMFSLREANWSHQVSFLIFYGAVCVCMLLSAAYHLFGCISRRTNEFLYKLDMTGICLMIFGSYLPGLTVGFSCRPDLALTYCVCIGAIIGAVIICHNVPACLDEKWFKVRIGLILSTVFFAVIPCLHWYSISTWDQFAFIAPVVVGTVFLYKIGFLFWMFKMPECWFPGKFDFIFNSHNIWHTFVVLAPLFWDIGLHSCLKLIYSGVWNCSQVRGVNPLEVMFYAGGINSIAKE